MAVQRWSTADGPVTEAALRAKLEALGYRVARYTYEPGTVFPDHKHGVDKIDAVVSGRFRLVVGGHLAVLGPGDWVVIPRGAVHSATVLGDVSVVSLDAVKL
ncbi:MAG: cupin domain-containing protein [Vicinamibacterales bacterium]